MKKSATHDEQVFNWVIIAIGIVAVLSNCLLIRLARRLKHRTTEIRLAVALAFVDMAIPTLGIAGSLANSWYDNDLDSLQKFCQIKGPIDFFLQYVSLLLVAIIAKVRFSKVLDLKIPSSIWIVISIYTVTFTSLLLLAGFRSEFYISPSGIDCSPLAVTSALSVAVLFGYGFSMIVLLLISLCCYLSLLGFVRETRSKVVVVQKRNLVVARITGICLVYFLLISPFSIMIMIEATYTYKTIDKTSLAISILVNLTSVANPCLVLFAHSLIFEQLQLCFPFNHHAKLRPSPHDDLPLGCI